MCFARSTKYPPWDFSRRVSRFLFLVSYAGFGFYGLYARNTAFVLMGMSTLVGAGVARRGNLVSIAVLSLLGGNIAPLVLGGNTDDLHAFLVYLLMLQSVALVLAAWGGHSKWWALRGVSLTTTTLWAFSLIVTGQTAGHHPVMIGFMMLAAALFQGELLYSTHRDHAPTRFELADISVVYSAFVSAAVTIGVLCLLHADTDFTRGIWVLSIGGACAAMGLARSGPPTPSSRLRFGFRVQAAALVALAVPVMLSGINIEIGWSVLAIVLACWPGD